MIMGILTNLFNKKHEIEKREKLPEDVFLAMIMSILNMNNKKCNS